MSHPKPVSGEIKTMIFDGINWVYAEIPVADLLQIANRAAMITSGMAMASARGLDVPASVWADLRECLAAMHKQIIYRTHPLCVVPVNGLDEAIKRNAEVMHDGDELPIRECLANKAALENVQRAAYRLILRIECREPGTSIEDIEADANDLRRVLEGYPAPVGTDTAERLRADLATMQEVAQTRLTAINELEAERAKLRSYARHLVVAIRLSTREPVPGSPIDVAVHQMRDVLDGFA